MAKQRFAGVLNAASFPLVAELQPRTVVKPELDNTVRTPREYYGTQESAHLNLPQLYYCENVVPTSEGFQSVEYVPTIAASSFSDFDQAITLRDENENVILMSPAGGKNRFYNPKTGLWESKSPLASWGGKLITRAYVNGRSFVCYEGVGLYEYDTATQTFIKRSIIGILDADIRGIGASSNYLLAFTKLTVYWSSLVNPLDLTPSTLTGAGFSIPQDVKARITAVLGTSGGFIIYTAKNAIAASFTNNVKSPFSFKEIGNSGGIQTYEQVASEQTSGPQYAWTTGGLQKITLQGAESVSAEISDFIAGQMYDYFDPVTKLPVRAYSTLTEFRVKLSFISSRFLVISYSTTGGMFNYAIFYDTVLKRYGKLKVDHVDCFQYPYPTMLGPILYDDLNNLSYNDLGITTYDDLNTAIISDPPSKFTIAFLTGNGAVSMLQMTYNKDSQHDAVAILGKFQIVRGKNIQLNRVTLEGVYKDTGPDGNPQFRCFAIASFDGDYPDNVQEMRLVHQQGKQMIYGTDIQGKNVSVLIMGTIALKYYELETVMTGDN